MKTWNDALEVAAREFEKLARRYELPGFDERDREMADRCRDREAVLRALKEPKAVRRVGLVARIDDCPRCGPKARKGYAAFKRRMKARKTFQQEKP